MWEMGSRSLGMNSWTVCHGLKNRGGNQGQESSTKTLFKVCQYDTLCRRRQSQTISTQYWRRVPPQQVRWLRQQQTQHVITHYHFWSPRRRRYAQLHNFCSFLMHGKGRQVHKNVRPNTHRLLKQYFYPTTWTTYRDTNTYIIQLQ